MSNGKNYTILDAPKLITTAREHAVLGLYPESLTKYRIAFNLIKQRVIELKDNFIKEKWRMTLANLNFEISQTNQMFESCKAVKNSPFDLNKKQQESEFTSSKNTNNNIFMVPFSDRPESKKQKPSFSERFGGRLPFQHQDDKRDPLDYFNENNIEINPLKNVYTEPRFKKEDKEKEYIRIEKKSANITSNKVVNHYKNKSKNDFDKDNFNVEKKSNTILDFASDLDFTMSDFPSLKHTHSNIDKNEPIVFDPPREKIIRESENKIVKNTSITRRNTTTYSQTSKNLGRGKTIIGKINDEVERYSASKNNKGTLLDKDNKGSNKEPSNKSSFLLHHYPNGNGPDSELIETLEREIIDSNPCVKFEDIAELDKAKEILKEAVLLPILMPNFFIGIRKPWRGVLLYGPPGTGKTMLAKALAAQGKTTFFNVHSSTFASKWRGESEKLVRLLFEMARFYAPTTIFIDEVDSLGTKRGEMNECESSRRVKSELLVQMDGISSISNSGTAEDNGEEKRKIVMVLAATNRPWDLDEALRRRFEKRVYVPLPNEKGREELFKLNLQNVKLVNNIDMAKLVKETDGYSGADIANVCREAAMMPMRKRILNNGSDILQLINNPNFKQEIDSPITQDELLEALKNISKSVSEKDLLAYEKWTAEFKSL